MLYRSKCSVIKVYANIESLVKVSTSGPRCCSLGLCGEHYPRSGVLQDGRFCIAYASGTYSEPNETACCNVPKRIPWNRKEGSDSDDSSPSMTWCLHAHECNRSTSTRWSSTLNSFGKCDRPQDACIRASMRNRQGSATFFHLSTTTWWLNKFSPAWTPRGWNCHYQPEQPEARTLGVKFSMLNGDGVLESIWTFLTKKELVNLLIHEIYCDLDWPPLYQYTHCGHYPFTTPP